MVGSLLLFHAATTELNRFAEPIAEIWNNLDSLLPGLTHTLG